MQAIRSAFPSHHLSVEDQIAEGDKVVTRVTFHGTHQGQFNGIAPTGKQVKWSGIAMDRIADGKVVEMWHVQNTTGLLQQLGAVTPTASKK
jgi:predicted ester cyclase